MRTKKQPELVLEVNRDVADKTGAYGTSDSAVMLTSPDVNENYWVLRVKLSPTQAVLGFPKFGTIGIGFAREEADWNRNLPFTTPTEDLYCWIEKNRAGADPDTCRKAIRMIQDAIVEMRLVEDRLIERAKLRWAGLLQE